MRLGKARSKFVSKMFRVRMKIMELHLNVFASGDQARIDHPAEHVVLAALGVDADKVDLGKSVFRTNLIDVAELSIG